MVSAFHNNLGNKETMAENIKYYMKKYNKSRMQICEDLGFRYSTFTEWINAKKYPRIDKIEMMANYFGISKADLVEDRNIYNKKSRAIRIPVLGRVIAGIPVDAIEEIIDYEEIDEQMAQGGDFYGLQIKGDSMEPRFVEGDVVIVRKQNDIDNGQIGIILVNGDEATVKKIKKVDNGIMLISFNNSYEPIFYSNEYISKLPVEIIGRVVELRGKF